MSEAVEQKTEFIQMIKNPSNNRAVKVGGKVHRRLVAEKLVPESTLPPRKATEKQLAALQKARDARGKNSQSRVLETHE